MKNTYSYLLVMALSFTIPLAAEPTLSRDIIQELLKPVQFSKLGLQSFFDRIYNKNIYTREVAPFSFDHLIDFIEFGLKLESKRQFIDAAFGIFHQKYTECICVNPYAFSNLLEKLPTLLGPLFTENKHEERSIIKKCIKNAMQQYSQRTSQEQMLTDLIADHIIAYHNEEPTIRDLQCNTTRFIELLLHKIVWDVREQQETWESVKTICNQLETLASHNIITDIKTLNQLYWIVISRYCYFIDCAGSQLTMDTYFTIEQELRHNHLSFLLFEEQEVAMKTKRQRLKEAVEDGILKVRAYHEGITTDGFVPLPHTAAEGKVLSVIEKNK